jgi:hypothetical protein
VLNERLNYNATVAGVNAFARENTRKKAPDWPGLIEAIAGRTIRNPSSTGRR